MARYIQGLVKDIEGVEQLIEIYRYGVDPRDPLYEIPYSNPEAIIFSHRGSGKDEWDNEVIQGTELTYSFFVPIADSAIVEELLESDYGYYYMSFWLNSVTEMFRGLLKPENMIADYLGNPDYIAVSVTATDALCDLKQSEFRNINGSLVTGRKTLLQVIQLALYPIQNLAVDCFVYLNTFENNLMTFSQCALEKIYVHCERFYEENEKGNDVMSCYDVITAVLKPFNCKLFQTGGGIKIINYYEDFVGYRYYYTGASWTLVSSGVYGMAVDITDYLFKPDIERQKIHPLRQIKTIFRNHDMGGDLTGVNLMALASYSYDFLSASVTVDGYLQFVSNHYSPVKHSDYLTLASDISVASLSVDTPTYLRLEMLYQISGLVDPASGAGDIGMEIELYIKRPVLGTDWQYVARMPLYGLNQPISFDSAAYGLLQLHETGAHNIKLVFKSKAPDLWEWNVLTIQIMSVKITRVMYGELIEYVPKEVSIDQDFIQYNDTGVEKTEEEVIIGDGNQITEVGALQSSGEVLTSSWTRLNQGETIKLVDSYTRNLLANRSAYKNFLRFVLIDRAHTVGILNSLIIQNKVYVFSSYTLNVRMGEIEAEVVEIILEGS